MDSFAEEMQFAMEHGLEFVLGMESGLRFLWQEGIDILG